MSCMPYMQGALKRWALKRCGRPGPPDYRTKAALRFHDKDSSVYPCCADIRRFLVRSLVSRWLPYSLSIWRSFYSQPALCIFTANKSLALLKQRYTVHRRWILLYVSTLLLSARSIPKYRRSMRWKTFLSLLPVPPPLPPRVHPVRGDDGHARCKKEVRTILAR